MKVGKGAIAVVIVALILTAITVYSIVNGGGNIGMGVLAAILFSLAGAGMITYTSGSVAEETMELFETENKAVQK